MLQGESFILHMQTRLLGGSSVNRNMSHFTENLHKTKKKDEKKIRPCIVCLGHL